MEDNIVTQMRKGIMEYCFLLILSKRRVYPSEIINLLKGSNLVVKEATVYTVLSRLNKEGKITYQWEESTMGPPRKYFQITDDGMAALATIEKVWGDINATITKLKEE
jgi:PadR family transcriptional regulator PadR